MQFPQQEISLTSTGEPVNLVLRVVALDSMMGVRGNLVKISGALPTGWWRFELASLGAEFSFHHTDQGGVAEECRCRTQNATCGCVAHV